jgi:serine/threonine protein kinase/tetratricopeptide (TPR) repeat protein
MNWPKPPFQVGSNIKEDRFFFDRNREHEELCELVDSTNSNIHLVAGPRRIGKSSLLLKCQRTFAATKCVALVDFSTFGFRRWVDQVPVSLKAGEVLDKFFAEATRRWCGSLGINGLDVPSSLTPTAFRKQIVLPLREQRPAQPLVLLLDEVEILEFDYPVVLQELILAIRECEPRELQAVISEGRQLGQPIPTTLKGLVRGAKTVEVGPFIFEDFPGLLSAAMPLEFDADSNRAVFLETGGHPLIFCGLVNELFKTRRGRDEPGLVTPREVGETAQKKELIKEIKDEMDWIWDKVPPQQRILARTVADLTWSDPESRFKDWASFEDVRAAMTHGTFGPELSDISEGAGHLAANFVLRVDERESCCQIYSPIFGYWLRDQSIHAFTTAPSVRARELVETAREARKAGQFEEARDSITAALQEYKENPEALQLASEIAEAQEAPDDALAYLRGAVQLQPSLAPSLVEFLRRQIISAADDQQPVEVWYQNLSDIAKDAAHAPDIQKARLLHNRSRWISNFRRGDGTAFVQPFEVVLWTIQEHVDIASMFRKALLEDVDRLTKEQLGSVGHDRRGWRLLSACFVPLTQAIDDAYESELERGIMRIIEGAGKREGDEKRLREIRDLFDSQRAAPWWDSAIELLDQLLRRQAAGRENVNEVIIVLRHFLQFAPSSRKERIARSFGDQVPVLFSNLIGTAWDAAAHVVGIMCDLPETPHDQIWLAIEEHVTAVAGAVNHADDLLIVDYIRSMPGIYSVWLAKRPSQHIPLIFKQFEQLVGRFRAKGQSQESDSWELLVAAGSAYRDWIRLFEHPLLAPYPEARELIARVSPPPGVIRRIGLIPGYGREEKWDEEVRSLLKGRYPFCTPVDTELYGRVSDQLRIYQTTWNGEDLNLKVFRFDLAARRDKSVIDLLEYFWQNERRALQNLTSHRAGHSLVRFRFVDSDFEKDGIRIVATEATGNLPLRRAFVTHSHIFLDKEKLWREILRLVEAVGAMHRLNYLHRAIRPENIFVKLTPDNSDYHFKLANFEWSVYLHEISGLHKESERLDYYNAPEVLAPIFRKESRTRGVSFSADIYSLGLVLYELLVQRFPQGELRIFRPGDDTYDPVAHREWLIGLRRKINEVYRESNAARRFLTAMLEPESHLRCPDLDIVGEDIAMFAAEASLVQRLLHDAQHPSLMAANLSGGRDSKGWIGNFLKLAQPDIDWTNLKEHLQKQLQGASIYASDGTVPIYIKAKDYSFVADRFGWKDMTKGGEVRVVDTPYFRVAGPRDRPQGPVIATLGWVQVEDVLDVGRVLMREYHQVVSRSEAWRMLFTLAEESEDVADKPQRQFYSLLSLTSEAEKALWQKQVIPYELVGKPVVEGSTMTVTIKGNLAARRASELRLEPLDRFAARQVARDDPYFELLKSDNPLTTSDEGLPWLYLEGHAATGEVTLKRQQPGPPPPAFGNIRPLSLAGSRAVHQRRQDLLRILEDDSYLLRGLTDLNRIRTIQPHRELTDGDFFDDTLDRAKKRIINRVLAEPPLFLVQGPPGTGKTTLAAELVRQTLRSHSSARILVVSQAHDPLDNLLLRVRDAYKRKNAHEPRKAPAPGFFDEPRPGDQPDSSPTLVRLYSANRIRARARTEDSKRVHEFLPSTVAQAILSKPVPAPREDSHVTPWLLARWRSFAERNQRALARSVENRIIDSANLVFVTANDRSLSDLPVDRSFDLLIFEEAARAYPLEILSAMRSARRWLLIGDHQQLSPFALEDFEHELQTLIDEALRWELESPRESSRERWNADVADFFRFLFEGKGLGMGDQKKPVDLLEAQWRMHPEIGNLMRDVYYKSMKNGFEEEAGIDEANIRKMFRHGFTDPRELTDQPLLWIDIPPADKNRLARERAVSGGGYVNHFEIAVIRALVKRMQHGHSLANRLVFLSPYRAQVHLLNRTFQNWKNPTTQAVGELAGRAFTIDSFQGRQAEIVIVSLVRNNDQSSVERALGFLADSEGKARTGVMCSRAQRLLIVVGCRAHFKRFRAEEIGGHLAEVSDYIANGMHGNSLLSKADDDYLNQQFRNDLRLEEEE